MVRAIFVCVAFLFGTVACTQRMACPAYQSAFIYDKDALRKKFSYFKEDSTPKILTASKNKYLVADPVPYRKKVRSMQTVEMKPIRVVIPDSLKFETIADNDYSMAERDIADSASVAGDSTALADSQRKQQYEITKDKEVHILRYDPVTHKYRVDSIRYNNDQDTYMWYLRDVLVLPDVKLAQRQTTEKEEKRARKEKKQGGFFRNLFRKKEKADTTSFTMEPEKIRGQYDFDLDDLEKEYDEPTDPDAQQESTVSDKKSKKKSKEKKVKEKKVKEKKQKQPKQLPEEKPKKKEEEEDDGFGF